MTIKYADRVQETSVSSGAGNLTLAGAVAGFRTINIVFNNDFDATGLPFDYVITSNSNNTWEIGTGKLLTSTLMERTTVINNSDENTSKINFSSGGLVITVTPSRDTLANMEGISLILSGTLASGAYTSTVTGSAVGATVESTSTGDGILVNATTGTGLHILGGNHKCIEIVSGTITVPGFAITLNSLTTGPAITASTSNAGFINTARGLIEAVISNGAASGTTQKIQNEGSGIGVNVDTNATGTNSAIKTDVALTSTNFKRQLTTGALSIWESDGATANGNLSGTVGDICLNGGTGTGQSAFCTGTTNWTNM